MSARSRFWMKAGGAVLSLIVLLLVIAIMTVRTQWFAEYVKHKIISVAEESTGGRVELGSFAFDWTHLRARVSNLVLHGSEPASGAPLLRIDSIELRLRLLPSFKRTVDLEYLGLGKPVVNVIVFPDGTTNVPAPKVPSKSDTPALETIVDLAIHQFDLNEGAVTFANQKIPFLAHGRNLRAQLSFNSLRSVYHGDITLEGLQFSQAGRPALEGTVKLPVTIAKDLVDLENASIETTRSKITLTGSLSNMKHPVVEAHLVSHVQLADVQRATGAHIESCTKNLPCFADADVNLHVDEQGFAISKGSLSLGKSNLNASGTRESANLQGKLVMAELGRVFNFPGDSIGDIGVAGVVSSGSKGIELHNFLIGAAGGKLTVDASLVDYKMFQLRGKLAGFDIADLEKRFLSAKQGYDGTIGGTVHVAGDLSKAGTTGIRAETQLQIVPARRGMPVKGHFDADYDGANNLVKIRNGSIALPHSLLTVSGILGTRLNADFTSTNTSDLYPAMAMSMKEPPAEIPLTLSGGRLELHAHADGPIASVSMGARVNVQKFSIEKRAFDQADVDLTASAKGVHILKGSLTRQAMTATFSGSSGLQNWALTDAQPISVYAELHNAEFADLLALAGEASIPTTGKLAASVKATGTVGNPQGEISVAATDGTIYEEAFQKLDLQVTMLDRLVRLTRAEWVGRAGTLQATGSYTHPRETLLSGDLRLHAESHQVQLNALANLAKQRAGMDGVLQLNLDASANVHPENSQTELLLTSLSGTVRVDNIREQSKSYGNLAVTAQTAGATVNFQADSNLSGSAIHASGQTKLAKDYPTTADLSIQNLQVENLPFDLGIPIKGLLAMNAHGQGTLSNPDVSAQLTFARGSIRGEPIDRLQAQARYTAQLIEVSSLQVTTPAGTAKLDGAFSHPVNDFNSGSIKAHLVSGDIQVARIKSLEQIKSGLGGRLKASLDVEAGLKTVNGGREVVPSRIDGAAELAGVTYGGRSFGDARLTAKTTAGRVDFALDSNLARSAIHAQGQATLTKDYPVTAQFSALDLRFSNFKPLLNVESPIPDLEALADIEGTVSGSAGNIDQLKGEVRIPRLEVDTPPRGSAKTTRFSLKNDGPLQAQLSNSIITIRSARMIGPRGTLIAVGGTTGLKDPNTMDVTVKADADLALLQDLDHDFYSSGKVSVDAAIRGSLTTPNATGSLQLKDASINMVGFSNGISNANGTIALNGTSASIRSLTGESGGGKVTLTGFAAMRDGTLRYSVKANASRVRTRQQGISIVNTAVIAVSGTSEQSLISGTVTIESVGMNPQSDFGSILASTSAAQGANEQVSPFLSNTRLDVRIRTSPDVRFQSSLARDLHAEANLTLIGTLSNPGMTGRVTVTDGDLIFFGNEYKVNHAVVSFYNPLRIEPQLNVSLETTVKSINVVLSLSGPIENLKLSYRSDPPLQFDEIVGLLATGKRPSSDPTIVANEAAAPQQSVAQMGASAVVSQAIASPISGRLERVFGVSQLKIDPTFESGSSLPQARLSLQQRVASNVTFTYTQDLSQSNSQLIRVEWAMSPRFSAVATRDVNGIIGVDFFYKRQFR